MADRAIWIVCHFRSSGLAKPVPACSVIITKMGFRNSLQSRNAGHEPKNFPPFWSLEHLYKIHRHREWNLTALRNLRNRDTACEFNMPGPGEGGGGEGFPTTSQSLHHPKATCKSHPNKIWTWPNTQGRAAVFREHGVSTATPATPPAKRLRLAEEGLLHLAALRRFGVGRSFFLLLRNGRTSTNPSPCGFF